MDSEVSERRNIEKRIMEEAEEKHKQSLWEDRHYGTPSAFWESAVALGLATPAERDMAKSSYGELWHYRGD